MTWGYWSIISGLLVLLGVFFICMEILYARARNGGGNKHAREDNSTQTGKNAA